MFFYGRNKTLFKVRSASTLIFLFHGPYIDALLELRKGRVKIYKLPLHDFLNEFFP